MHRRPAALLLTGATALALLTGCTDAGTVLPGEQPLGEQRLVVRTPAAVAPDLPYEAPPVVVPLPGETGGPPAPAPDGEDSNETAQ